MISSITDHSGGRSVSEPFRLPREEAVNVVRRKLGHQREEIRKTFESLKLNGVEAAHALAAAMDEAVTELAENAGLNQKELSEEFCICATGSYGAQLLAPFSDIDLLFITGDKPSQTLLRQIEYILYSLWDLGLKVGHATHSVESCLLSARNDQVTCTTLLYLRPLYGEPALAEAIQEKLRNYLTGEKLLDFINAKIKEREIRHQRFGETPYLVEPNLKEGRGGLRDLQVLNWIGRASLDALSVGRNPALSMGLAPTCVKLGLLSPHKSYRAQKVWNFLWTVRFHLHYITGRNEERLTFDVQPIIGARMGYATHGHQKGVERFMRHYFLMARIVLRLARVLQPAIMLHILTQQSGIPLKIETGPENFIRINGRLAFSPDEKPQENPEDLFKILDCARRYQLELHPNAVQQLINNENFAASLRGNPEASKIFLDLLCDPVFQNGHLPRKGEKERPFLLPLFNETGLLGRFIIYWSRIVGRTQFDSYHIFAVDEHSIESVRILRQIEAGQMADEIPFAYTLTKELQARKELYLATFLHDIGKGYGGDHSSVGADLCLAVCQQLCLSQEETDTVSWLILHHLLLTNAAFTRDIDDPNIILDLADIIQSPERLKLLLLLTIADIRAVSPRAWNAWKATLLHRLYSRISDVLNGGLQTNSHDSRINEIKTALGKSLSADLKHEDIAAFMALGQPSYWLSFDQNTLERHARLIAIHKEDTAAVIDIQPLPSRDITELTIFCRNQPGLFSKIAGALALCGAIISDARIHTFSDDMILDTFWIQDGYNEAFEEPSHIKRLQKTIHDVLDGKIHLEDALGAATLPLTRRMGALYIPSRVIYDNNTSEIYTILEVSGRDRPALLHDITYTLYQEGAIISSAHIATYGLRVVDVFYICDKNGRKLAGDQDQLRIRSALLKVLTDQSSQKT